MTLNLAGFFEFLVGEFLILVILPCHILPALKTNQTEARNFRDVLRPQKNDDARSGFARYSEIIKNMVRRTEADLLEFKFDCPIIQLHGAVAFHQSQHNPSLISFQSRIATTQIFYLNRN